MDKNHLIEQLGKAFGDNPRFRALVQQEALLSMVSAIKEDTGQIRALLNMEASPSIDYSFISDEFKVQREELELDNLKMENMRLKMVKHDKDKLIEFTYFGARQVENLLNIYFDIIKVINVNDYEEWIELENKNNPKNTWHNYIPNKIKNIQENEEKKQKNLADLDLGVKITFLEYSENISPWNLRHIKDLRNSVHPAKNDDEKQNRNVICEKIDKQGGYNMVREEVQKVVKIVKNKLQDY